MVISYTSPTGIVATPNANATPAQIAAGSKYLNTQGFSSGAAPTVAPQAPTTTSTGGYVGTPIVPTATNTPQTPISTIPKTGLPSASSNQPTPVIPQPAEQPPAPTSPPQSSTAAADIGAKYRAYHASQSVLGEAAPAPQNGPEARTAIAQSQPQTVPSDPATTAVSQAYAELVKNNNNATNYENTLRSITSYQNEISTGLGIPQLQAEDLNIKTIMNGSENDIRSEISATGGTATESQVEAMTATRNKTLVKQATNVENQLSIAQNSLSTYVSSFQADQSTVLTALKDRASNSYQNLSLLQSMQKSSVANWDKMLTAGGISYLASTIDEPSKRAFESANGYTSGSLSNPAWVAAHQAMMYKQQQMNNAGARITLALGNIPGSDVTPAAPNIIPGNAKDTDVVNGAGGLTVGAVRSSAMSYLATGTLASMGTSGKGKTAIVNEAAVIQSELGLSDADVVTLRQSYKADFSSLSKLQVTADSSQAFESTANKNISLAQQYSSKVLRTGSPLANNYDLWASGQLKGDPNTVAFETAVYTAATEYAKVVGGSTGGQGLTDSARNEAGKILSASLTPDQFDAVVGVMQQDMENKISSYGTQINDIKNRTLNKLGGSVSDTTPEGPRTAAVNAGVDYDQLVNDGYSPEQIQEAINSK